MKSKPNPKIIAMMAACALVATVGQARAQGMPADAQQLIQTMRPMQMSNATPDRPAEDRDYGGASQGASVSAAGPRANTCDTPTLCDTFRGQ